MNGAPIGYLLKKFPRLSETFVLNEILGLERNGWPVHVFSRRAPDSEPRHPQLARLRAEVIPMVEIDPWPALLAEDGERVALPRVAALVEEAELWGPKLPSLLGEALHLLPLLRRRRIAHLHAHFATDSAVVAALARELGGSTYSVTLHAKDIYRDGVSFERLERILEGAAMAVTVCDANVAHLRQRLRGRAAAKVRRLYNGIDLTRFAPRAEEARRDADHILAVGRLVEKKGFAILLRAVAELHRRGAAARVTIVGEGEERPALEEAIGRLDLAGTVHFAGALDQAAVRELMARATVFCLPCVVGRDGNQDALPTVLLEALASGLPVISTPVGGIPEIVDSGRAGVLVPAGDVEAVARALEALLASPALRESLAGAGRRRAELLFDGDRNSLILSAWLREIVTRSGGEVGRPGAAEATAAGAARALGTDAGGGS
ncbi:MAG TPA: glycosyltransferase [Planctomycetota bacterium]|nr:glycosyltransferase [Planctomycetota bacterium]